MPLADQVPFAPATEGKEVAISLCELAPCVISAPPPTRTALVHDAVDGPNTVPEALLAALETPVPVRSLPPAFPQNRSGQRKTRGRGRRESVATDTALESEGGLRRLSAKR
jgi:hypothetical protein